MDLICRIVDAASGDRDPPENDHESRERGETPTLFYNAEKATHIIFYKGQSTRAIGFSALLRPKS